MALGRVAEIWRYPVSGLQGEKLTQAQVLKTGIAGDHIYVLRSKEWDKILDPISHSSSLGETDGLQSMLEFAATLSGDPVGEHDITIETAGRAVYSGKNPADLGPLSAELGHSLELVRYPRIVETRVRAGRTLHLLTDASLEHMRRICPGGDFDSRRFRPNVMMTVDEGLSGCAEEGWIGKELNLGAQVRLRVEKADARCKMTTMKQAGVREDGGILQTIQRENAGNLGVMCTVVREGVLRAGDSVSLA